MARQSWKKEQVVAVLNSLIEEQTHRLYITKKKNNKMNKWYDVVGERVGVTGTKVTKLREIA